MNIKLLGIGFLICFVLFMGWFLLKTTGSTETAKSGVIRINNTELEVEIADTVVKRARGLSGRQEILHNQGMLFIFKRSDFHSFWMKDMKFAIDIIWIDKNLKIISIDKNVLPELFPGVFSPSGPVQYVLEVNSGWTDEYSIKIGDTVSFLD